MLDQINNAKSGNQIAFYNIWNQYNKKVFYFILQKTHDVNFANEITNYTFTKAFLKIDTYNPDYKFSTWLFAIAKNTLFENIQSKPFLFVDISEIENSIIIDSFDFVEIENEREFLLQNSINKLRPIYKEVIKLQLENYKYQQIAEITGLSLANIKVIINRAKRQLTQIMLPVANGNAA